jgi:hypothetical protein
LQYPFLFQYKVRPNALHKDWQTLNAAIATVMVFADSKPLGRCRSGRFITQNLWDTVEFMRVMIICPHQVKNFDPTLGKVYRQAELFGIAACFDSWTAHPH